MVMVINWVMKVVWEVLLIFVIYGVVGWFKGCEGVEVFDIGIEFLFFVKVDSV